MRQVRVDVAVIGKCSEVACEPVSTSLALKDTEGARRALGWRREEEEVVPGTEFPTSTAAREQ